MGTSYNNGHIPKSRYVFEQNRPFWEECVMLKRESDAQLHRWLMVGLPCGVFQVDPSVFRYYASAVGLLPILLALLSFCVFQVSSESSLLHTLDTCCTGSDVSGRVTGP